MKFVSNNRKTVELYKIQESIKDIKIIETYNFNSERIPE